MGELRPPRSPSRRSRRLHLRPARRLLLRPAPVRRAPVRTSMSRSASTAQRCARAAHGIGRGRSQGGGRGHARPQGGKGPWSYVHALARAVQLEAFILLLLLLLLLPLLVRLLTILLPTPAAPPVLSLVQRRARAPLTQSCGSFSPSRDLLMWHTRPIHMSREAHEFGKKKAYPQGNRDLFQIKGIFVWQDSTRLPQTPNNRRPRWPGGGKGSGPRIAQEGGGGRGMAQSPGFSLSLYLSISR